MGKRPDIVEDLIKEGPKKVYVLEPCLTYLEDSGSGFIFNEDPDVEDGFSVLECWLIPVKGK